MKIYYSNKASLFILSEEVVDIPTFYEIDIEDYQYVKGTYIPKSLEDKYLTAETKE